jgi:hypothetical protein
MYKQLDVFRKIAVWNVAPWCSAGHLPSISPLFVKAREAALRHLFLTVNETTCIKSAKFKTWQHVSATTNHNQAKNRTKS